MSKIFICYRKSDTETHAQLLQRDLAAQFGTENVFLDRHSLLGGDDFDERIRRFIVTCDAVVVVIGPTWLQAIDEHGRPRIHLDTDVLRSEIEVALTSHVRVVPVLVMDATMPSREQLPPSLQALSRLNALELPNKFWEFGVKTLVQAIPLPKVEPPEEEVDDKGLERVRELCDRGAQTLGSDAARTRLEAVSRGLQGSLKVAVVGSAGAGKSTLVNALIGTRIAPTGDGDITRVAGVYSKGGVERAEVLLRDSSKRTVPLADDGPPSGLGVSPDEVKRMLVTLPSERLAALALIDTPGLSADGHSGSGPVDLLREAEAIVYVVEADAQIDVSEALRMARAHLAGTRVGDEGMVVVVTKIDLLDTPQAAPDARAIAACRREESLHPNAIAVMPLNALVAETVEGVGLREDHFRDLVALAALPERKAVLDDLDGVEPEVPRSRRQELVRLLGDFGLWRSLELIDDGCADRADLVLALREASGSDRIVELIDTAFRQRAPALKASRALTEIERVVTAFPDEPAAATLARDCRRLRDDLALDVLTLLDKAKRIGVPTDLVDDLTHLTTPGQTAQRLGLPDGAERTAVEEAAIGAIRRWKRFGDPATASGAERRLAGLVVDRYLELLDRLLEPAASGGTAP
jgi:GTPase SAR1 family protein